MRDLGIAGLTIIFIGLIVTWTGYVRRVRSAWFVMFVVVWGWAFPLWVLPAVRYRAITLSEWIYTAIHQSGISRTAAEAVLIFCIMVIALLLPIRSFFLPRKSEPSDHGPSPKFIGISVVTLLVLVITLLVWVHTPVYEIPPEMLRLWQQMPPPPPPPR
jgi:hypothetical protein